MVEIKYKFSSQLIFALVMEDPQLFKGLLERIFPDKKIVDLKSSELVEPIIEATGLTAADAKQVRFDVLFEGENEWIDVEMQRTVEKFLPLRCRYYSSIIDIKELKRGQNYSDLKKSYVIFICEFDYFGDNEPMYAFARSEVKSGLPLNDNSYIIILNTKSSKDDIPKGLKNLFDYINDGSIAPNDAFIKSIHEAVESLQSREEVAAFMTMYEEMEALRQIVEKEKKAVERELKAAENELKAAENELKAAENELKAAENELKATEKEKKAVENELKAAENELKATEKERDTIIEEIRREKLEMVRKMRDDGLSKEAIKRYTGLAEDEIV